MKNEEKIAPSKPVSRMFRLDEETDEMLDDLTIPRKRSWLVRKLIRDTYIREKELVKRGKIKGKVAA
jgi:predicted transcriptional regulator